MPTVRFGLRFAAFALACYLCVRGVEEHNSLLGVAWLMVSIMWYPRV
jgi:hypothetical protein